MVVAETVDKAKQLLFMDRVLFQFGVKRRQVKNVSAARLGVEQWDQTLEACAFLGHVLEAMATATGQADMLIFKSPCLQPRPRTRWQRGPL